MTRRLLFAAATFFIVVGAALGLIAAALTTQMYRTEVRLFVSSSQPASTSSAAFVSTFYSRLTDLGTSAEVTRAVIADLHLDMTDQELADEIDIRHVVNTVIVELSVTDPDRAVSEAVTKAVATQFAKAVATVTNVGPGIPSDVRLTVMNPARSGSLGRPWGRDVVVGAAGGLVAAALVLLLVHRRRTGNAGG